MAEPDPSRFGRGCCRRLRLALLGGVAGAAAWDVRVSATRPKATATRELAARQPRGTARHGRSACRPRDGRAHRVRCAPGSKAPYPGAVLGNPNGKVTLVEFSDYACGFCRQSVADVAALVAANPDLQGGGARIPDPHPRKRRRRADGARRRRPGQIRGVPQRDVREQAARARRRSPRPRSSAGVDLAAARAAIESGKYEDQLADNHALAGEDRLQRARPAWVVGEARRSRAQSARRRSNTAVLRAREG